MLKGLDVVSILPSMLTSARGCRLVYPPAVRQGHASCKHGLGMGGVKGLSSIPAHRMAVRTWAAIGLMLSEVKRNSTESQYESPENRGGTNEY